MEARTVQVDVSTEVSPLFSRFILDGVKTVSTKATARLTSRAPICLVGLDRRLEGTLSFRAKAQLTADRCAVYSNSGSPKALLAEDAAKASAALLCTRGGYAGRKSSFTPEPLTDCPAVEDPLASRPPPQIGGCVAVDKRVEKVAETLTPGTYCGGLRVTAGASVTLLSGVYVIKGGPLVVNQKSSLQGQNVGLFFAGDKASLLFDRDSVVTLTAPRDGPMAGLLMSEEREVTKPDPAPTPTDPLTGLLGGVGALAASLLAPLLPPDPPPMREYRILSDEVRTMLGTIYLPSGRLMIDSKKAVADRSAYTVIVVRRLELFEGPNLHLNSNYGGTDIPVPKGVGPINGEVALTR